MKGNLPSQCFANSGFSPQNALWHGIVGKEDFVLYHVTHLKIFSATLRSTHCFWRWKRRKKKSKWHRTHFFLWLETQRKEFPTIPNIFSNSLCKKPKDLINKTELVYSISYWYPSKFIFLINSSSSQTQLNQNKS